MSGWQAALVVIGYIVVCPPFCVLWIAWLMVLWQERQWRKQGIEYRKR